jgi:hypothetical protein
MCKMQKRVIGFCGKMRVGKDTACKLLHCQRYAFADELKNEIRQFLLDKFNIDVFHCNEQQKEMIRPLLVGLGESRRNQDNDYWVKKVMESILEDAYELCGVTDVRYANEIEQLLFLKQFGYDVQIVRIHRQGYNTSNLTEEKSFAEIDKKYPDLLQIHNDSTIEVYKEILVANLF